MARVRQFSAVENAPLSVLSLAASSSVSENASTTVSISGLPLVDSTFVFEQDPVPVWLSSPVGEVSFRPGSPLAVSRISSANFLLSSPDRIFPYLVFHWFILAQVYCLRGCSSFGGVWFLFLCCFLLSVILVLSVLFLDLRPHG